VKFFIVFTLLTCEAASAAERPNILWLTCEDNNVNGVGCYGNPHAETPDYLQGKIFLGPDAEEREYHVSYRMRMDERCDNVRAIRDQRFLYIRNYMPFAPWGQHLNYLWNMRATQAREQHHREGKTDAITGRFFGTKPMEELYDTTVDPDNVHNLIEDPEYEKEVERLSKALDEWQLKNFDAGLLPETELVKRAEESGKTIYELVRDPGLYDLENLHDYAGFALRQPRKPSILYCGMAYDDPGIRYWAMVGLFNCQEVTEIDLDFIREYLEDESDHVRAMAAWILYRGGDKKTAQDCWNKLLEEDSYASLMIFNIIDWIGDGVEPYAESMRACNYSHGGYVGRMKKYLGVGERPKKLKDKSKKKKGR